MPRHSVPPAQALPRSHYFVTVSRGTAMRTVAVRTSVLRAGLVVLPLLLVVGVASALYLAFHDDLVGELMRREAAMQYAYEDRIEALRQDLERQGERAKVDQTKLGDRVRDLFAREARLEHQAALIGDLGGGAVPARLPALPPEITGRIAPPPAAALGYAPDGKPHPLLEPAAPGPAGPAGRHPEDHAALGDPAMPVAERLGFAELALARVERGQAGALTRIAAAAHRRADRVRTFIEDAGLSPDRYLAKPIPAAVGGPFVPLPEGPEAGFDRALAASRGAVAAAAQLAAALPRLPFAAPLLGRLEVTSPFGPRTDPFLGRPALHTGVDLHEGYGTEVQATGAGRVAFAGTAGGYGNMVEVDHGNGIATRYAHMGSIAVTEGQAVGRGAVLGRVGATGRATGPHLHYEVRIDGEPVDPTRFLSGADRLASLEAP